MPWILLLERIITQVQGVGREDDSLVVEKQRREPILSFEAK